MSLSSLNHLLNHLESQESWKERQQFKRLLKAWPAIVGPVVAAQTRPLGIQGDSLKIATSSSVWAQNLVFERRRILEKLNQQLSLSLADIRFSTAGWQQPAAGMANAPGETPILWRDHPSLASGMARPRPRRDPSQPDPTPESAFQQWASMIQAQARNLPTCPQCHCPCPQGELDRWAICSICLRNAQSS
ncbi:hypothetical protein BST81_17080 [Leptolyngbya sp. 'hensonii']|uniref:DUF721 domain-containing protein n=1 Tax=Leptolyngbya sp. 'hensonii' TaxID=1922337 RepID=UPI00094F508B|nr:DUF721 domain-containing protein [Leptolyngbya sp. 'hensonii']OLP17072.1 hypothetical protein BST81_17080 [Leptolyngbya sp. 'hensonii']